MCDSTILLLGLNVKDWIPIGSAVITAIVAIVATSATKKNVKSTISSSNNNVASQVAASIKTSEDNIRANTVTKFRQEWINSLRNELAEFSSLPFQVHEEAMVFIEGGSFEGSILQKNLDGTLYKKYQKISLYLNLTEKNHEKLILLMQSIVTETKYVTLGFEAWEKNRVLVFEYENGLFDQSAGFELDEVVREACSSIESYRKTVEQLGPLTSSFMDLSAVILKDEWERVKKGI